MGGIAEFCAIFPAISAKANLAESQQFCASLRQMPWYGVLLWLVSPQCGVRLAVWWLCGSLAGWGFGCCCPWVGCGLLACLLLPGGYGNKEGLCLLLACLL